MSVLQVCLTAGSQAGIVGALTLLAKGYRPVAAVSCFDDLTRVLGCFDIPVYSTADDERFLRALCLSDLLLSVHSREILKARHLSLPRLGCINVHPYLYKYKGANPVGRALKERNFKASVGVHRMEEQVDAGELILEEFVDVSGEESAAGIYNRLYPYYSMAILKALELISVAAARRD